MLTPTIEQLEAEYQYMTAKEIARKHGMTPEAVRQRLSYYGITSPRRSKAEERCALVRKLWMRGDPQELATYLGCCTRSVKRHAKKLGLGRPMHYTLFDLNPVAA